ncbi:hypothetical protein JXA88_02015 [Candidatus Fermentibacteria bacterium]|nr:hypothetical protein [Candidatus Fermentibacteria bacterium]
MRAFLRACAWVVCTLLTLPFLGPCRGETAGPDTAAFADSVIFMPLHVYIDPGGQPLAAYQVELSDSSASSIIVGIEGGEHPAFRSPPYHDPKALRGNRIALAAFSTARDLPRTRSRVATVHLMAKAAITPVFEPVLSVAATRDGTRIKASVRCEFGDAQ